ncbi:MAG: hypothetical protein ACR2LL_02145 [Nitrosopumilus sp.]
MVQMQVLTCNADRIMLLCNRANQNDYVCIREPTAEIWERHEMGTTVDKKMKRSQLMRTLWFKMELLILVPNARKGTLYWHNISESKYKCVSESTAENCLDEGISEVHDLLQYISGKDQYKKVLDEAYEINQKIVGIDEEYALKQVQLEAKYNDPPRSQTLQDRQKRIC